MRTTIRRAAAAITAALAVGTGSALWATSSASAAPSAPAALIPVCTAADLSVWVNIGLVQGAAGTWYYPLEFTNDSSHTCRTWGWPGVSAADAKGRQLAGARAEVEHPQPRHRPPGRRDAPGHRVGRVVGPVLGVRRRDRPERGSPSCPFIRIHAIHLIDGPGTTNWQPSVKRL